MIFDHSLKHGILNRLVTLYTSIWIPTKQKYLRVRFAYERQIEVLKYWIYFIYFNSASVEQCLHKKKRMKKKNVSLETAKVVASLLQQNVRFKRLIFCFFFCFFKLLSFETTYVINFFPSVIQGWFIRYAWISGSVAMMFSGFLIFHRNKFWVGFSKILKIRICKSIWFYFKIELWERFHFSTGFSPHIVSPF